ncbi:hypothetical protein BCT46_23810 [Vibrio sp. 10N.261.46.E8]|nr:hypothetical protein BH584_25185 [Vibrio sp. 10N.261.45.E1]PMJ34973.1 hypothetical protein BCU27_24390 [Vibrio sp. 10N.286.45.B6]PML93726.1 hypothetical protein BCT66_24220 [Vibrio sp. 10N.261.49.E11]PMM90196.1 hypothetical protein BCT46_23810 [Vibrio sp. 10N.261.46.E8]PMN54015.1 hypothetical protein BCT32_24545 [Vibrio sp. 10N.261.45.E11]PMN93123.1 hypothetical protein BCT22_23935 [Vibrio sp. 10N.261.45.A1]
MPTSKPSLINANFKRFMKQPKWRIENAQYLDDLLKHTNFGIRCHQGKLSMKVKDGHLAAHRYNQDKKKS